MSDYWFAIEVRKLCYVKHFINSYTRMVEGWYFSLATLLSLLLQRGRIMWETPCREMNASLTWISKDASYVDVTSVKNWQRLNIWGKTTDKSLKQYVSWTSTVIPDIVLIKGDTGSKRPQSVYGMEWFQIKMLVYRQEQL